MEAQPPPEKPQPNSAEFAPVDAVSFISPKTHGGHRSVGANIMPNGDLVISGLDWEPDEMMIGDHEYSVTIEARYKDSVLLLLLKEQFADFRPAKAWLEKVGVPFKSWSWG